MAIMTTDTMTSKTDLKKRGDVHWARKLWHMSTVTAMFLVWHYAPSQVSYGILILAYLLFVPIDFLRQYHRGVNEVLVHAFKPIMRQGEEQRLAGTTFLLTGVLIIVLLFPKPVVSLSLLFLAFADPIASYFGIRYGKDKLFGHKSLQGFLAAYVVCSVLSLAYLLQFSTVWDRALVCSLLAGFVGAMAELVPVAKLDDNLTLPVFSAIGLNLLFYFFGFFPALI